VLERQHSVLGGDAVESGALLVTKERVRRPDGVPAVVAQAHFGFLTKLVRIKLKSTVHPLLA